MELKELIERVRAATGPDRGLDVAIAQAFYNTETYRISDDGECEELADGFDDAFGMTGWFPTHQEVPTYTASIDAALALVERCLPGWVVSDLCQNSRHAGDPWGCELAIYYGSNPSKNSSSFSGYDFPTAPLAIILALLTALDQKEENK